MCWWITKRLVLLFSFVRNGVFVLSCFQAGAKHVYAVEASEMAEYARKLIAGNPILGQRITVRFFHSFL